MADGDTDEDSRGSEISNGLSQPHRAILIDGGARRTILLRDAKRARPLPRETLLNQLARSELFHRDDPAKDGAVRPSA